MLCFCFCFCFCFFSFQITQISFPLDHHFIQQVQYNARGDAGARYKGPIDCVRKVIKEEGLRRGIYRGWVPTAFCRMSNYAYFGTYEWMRRYLSGDSSQKLTLGPSMVAGGSAGVAYWLSCYPMDVIKNRIMAGLGFGTTLFFFFAFICFCFYLLMIFFSPFLNNYPPLLPLLFPKKNSSRHKTTRSSRCCKDYLQRKWSTWLFCWLLSCPPQIRSRKCRLLPCLRGRHASSSRVVKRETIKKLVGLEGRMALASFAFVVAMFSLREGEYSWPHFKELLLQGE